MGCIPTFFILTITLVVAVFGRAFPQELVIANCMMIVFWCADAICDALKARH